MTVVLQVDGRETGLLDALEKHAFGLSNAVEVRSVQLHIGDAVITYTPADAAQPSVELVFERKTVADLVASIKDGRYREQKARLLAHYVPKNICYVVEGMPSLDDPNETFFGIRASAITSAVIHTMYRDGMHFYFTKNVQDTAKWLALVCAKVAAHPDKFTGASASQDAGSGGGAGEGTGSTYVEHVKAKACKISNIDPRTCYTLQLCQIPLISQKIAIAIVDRYPTFRSLFEALDRAETDKGRQALLCEIPLLGAKKADNILKFLNFT